MQRFAHREVTARKYPIIILHIKGVEREFKHFGEMIYDLGVVIESVREFIRVRPVAVSENPGNRARQGDSDRQAGRRVARTSAMKRKIRAAREASARLLGRPLCMESPSICAVR